jgi:mono/diheme cytochrome c family protein
MMSKTDLFVVSLVLAGGLILAGCGSDREADEEEESASLAPSAVTTTPTPAPTPTPTPTPTPSVAYVQDLKPVFDRDCVSCHGGSRPSAGYNMSTYAGVMALVRAGDASSRLVVATRSNGSMYGHFSGDRAGKSDLVRRWVVDNGAAQSR